MAENDVRQTCRMDQSNGTERAAAFRRVPPDTIRRWERQGEIRGMRAPGGKRRIAESAIRRLRGEVFSPPQRVLAMSGRVSSHEQKAWSPR
jgi:excisionase family DNA binding protein